MRLVEPQPREAPRTIAPRKPCGCARAQCHCSSQAQPSTSHADPGAALDAPGMLDRLGPGSALPGGSRSRMEAALGHSFANVQLHADAGGAGLARELGASAFTVGDHIGFAHGAFRPGTLHGDALLAHELAHVVQQAGGSGAASREALERDADAVAAAAVLGAPARPAQRGPTGVSLSRCGAAPQTAPPMTRDQMLVARAHEMIPILREYIQESYVRRLRRQFEPDTRDRLLASRRTIEDPLAAATGRPELEAQRLRSLNRRALRVEVTGEAVIFHVRFQAAFENPADRARFGELQRGLEGAARRWALPSDRVAHGLGFELDPQVTLVDSVEDRDQDHWLIQVRADDHGPVTHPRCRLDDPRPVVAAVTDSACDGGVMNLPPGSIGNGELIAHEMHHLFGLVDRYLMATGTNAAGQPTVQQIPMRSPGRGRQDPLGGEHGPVLEEDIAFLFDNLGVYDDIANAGLTTLQRLESRGMDEFRAVRLLDYFERVVQANGDPDSLIRPRTDFNDRMQRSAEDL